MTPVITQAPKKFGIGNCLGSFIFSTVTILVTMLSSCICKSSFCNKKLETEVSSPGTNAMEAAVEGEAVIEQGPSQNKHVGDSDIEMQAQVQNKEALLTPRTNAGGTFAKLDALDMSAFNTTTPAVVSCNQNSHEQM